MKKLLFLIGVITFLFGLNGLYQVINKPAELISAFSSGRFKSVSYTWKAYEDDFDENETAIMTKYYLAALSQKESAGNSLATPKWRWQFTTDVRRIYAPASSSVGLFQYINATLKDAKRFCIHWGRSVQKGAWYDYKSCWFNGLYTRFSASNSIEMTSARLDFYVRQLAKSASLINQQNLASVIHLCGLRKGRRFVKEGFEFKSFNKCGRHNAKKYINRVQHLKRRFQKM